jgi:hypothetical protein
MCHCQKIFSLSWGAATEIFASGNLCSPLIKGGRGGFSRLLQGSGDKELRAGGLCSPLIKGGRGGFFSSVRVYYHRYFTQITAS